LLLLLGMVSSSIFYPYDGIRNHCQFSTLQISLMLGMARNSCWHLFWCSICEWNSYLFEYLTG